MWIDLPGWQAQSSYVQPVAPPGTDPEAAPLVCLSFNQTWLPYVIGSLMQLVQPAAWSTSDPTVLAGVLQDAQTLIQLFGAAEACTMLTFQFTDTCVLQFSLDGGATWQDVAGWPTNAPGCYTGATGATGATGPAGGFTPGIPPIQPGQTTAGLACAVAGYLAQYVIQVSLSAVVTGYNTAQTALEVATGILALIPGVDVVFAAVTGAVTLLYGFVTSATIAQFTTAESDPLLLGDLTCAIYTATSGDGYVTASNFAAVEAAIAAISYTYPDVISAISEWLDALGYDGIAAAQIPGALALVDCSGCAAGGNAGLANGSDSGVAINAGSLLGLSGAVSVATWLNLPSAGEVGYIASQDWNGTDIPLYFRLAGGPTFEFGSYDPVHGDQLASYSTALPHGVNIHVCGTFDGSTYTLYLNGSPIASAAGSRPAANGARWLLGTGFSGGSYSYLHCGIWKTRVYDVALTAANVASLYSTGTTTQDGNLVADLEFSEGTGTSVADTAGGGNTGTWFGTPPYWTTY